MPARLPPDRHHQEVDEHHRRQDDQGRADEVGQVLAEQHRAARDRPGEEIGDRLVLDLVGDQRRAVEHAEHRHDEPEEEHARSSCRRWPGRRRAAPLTRSAGHADGLDDPDEQRPAAPGRRRPAAMKIVRRDHSISPSDRSKIGRGAAQRRRAGPRTRRSRSTGGRGRHRHFTRYWKTACRLSSGEVTSSIGADLAGRGQAR